MRAPYKINIDIDQNEYKMDYEMIVTNIEEMQTYK